MISRHELARRCGLTELHERRCDSILVHVRQALGPDSIVTVRRRGWMLHPEAMGRATALLDDTSRTSPAHDGNDVDGDDIDGEMTG